MNRQPDRRLRYFGVTDSVLCPESAQAPPHHEPKGAIAGQIDTPTATAAHDNGDGGTDSNAGNESANTTSTVATHDVAVTAVTASPSVDQGQTVNVD